MDVFGLLPRSAYGGRPMTANVQGRHDVHATRADGRTACGIRHEWAETSLPVSCRQCVYLISRRAK